MLCLAYQWSGDASHDTSEKGTKSRLFASPVVTVDLLFWFVRSKISMLFFFCVLVLATDCMNAVAMVIVPSVHTFK